MFRRQVTNQDGELRDLRNATNVLVGEWEVNFSTKVRVP